MKLKHIFGLGAAVVMLASCDSNELADISVPAEGKALHINRVSQDGFATAEGTRSTFSETFATVFETGDRLGLVLVDNNGRQVANVPFTYTEEGTWSNDNNQLYRSDVAKIVAYAPYDAALPADVCDASGVKNATAVGTDQSNTDALKAADLLVCELDNTDELDIRFAHAFSMLCFSSKGSVNVGGTNYEYGIALNNISVTVGNESYTPCPLNGSYVAIVKDNTSLQPEEFKYSYIRYGEERATKTIVAATTTNASTIYSFPCPSTGEGEAGVGAGSYYCTAEGDGTVVLLPAGAANVPAGLNCRGIVFHTMESDEFAGFAADNDLDVAAYPGINGVHGLVISPEQGGVLFSNYTGDEAQNALIESLFSDFAESGNTDKSLGYKLTIRMMALARDGGALTFSALDDVYARLPHCTSWYIPSFNELKYMIRGEKNYAIASVDGQELLNSLLAPVSGVLIEGNIPSATYKPGSGFCIMQNGDEMGWHGVPTGEKCRPVCAF